MEIRLSTANAARLRRAGEIAADTLTTAAIAALGYTAYRGLHSGYEMVQGVFDERASFGDIVGSFVDLSGAVGFGFGAARMLEAGIAMRDRLAMPSDPS